MKTCGFGSYGFDKESRSTFKYWFAHWCAFQMVALNLHVWRPKYLLHDIEKPWLRLFFPYAEVQIWHREHSNHHLEYLKKHNVEDIDIMAMIIDCECSRFTKQKAPLTAKEEIAKLLNLFLNDVEIGLNIPDYVSKEIIVLGNALEQIKYLPLEK